MNTLAALALGASLLAASAPQSATASDNMHDSFAMPACTSHDKLVGVNLDSKIYLSHDQLQAEMKGMTDVQIQAMLAKRHLKVMCRSKAQHMGATMMGANMMKPSM